MVKQGIDSRLIIRIGCEAWLAFLTMLYGFLDFESARAILAHLILPAISIALTIPWLLQVSLSGVVSRVWAAAIATVTSFWLLALLTAWQRFGVWGVEWLDTVLVLFPLTLSATRHGKWFVGWLSRRVVLIGAYFSVLVLLYWGVGFAMPAYEGIEGQLFTERGVHLVYPTFMWLAILLIYERWIEERSQLLLIYLLLVLTGIILEGHRSMIVGVIVSIAFMWSVRRPVLRKALISFPLLVIIAMSMVLASWWVPSLIFGEDAAIASRASINAFRWDELSQSPLLGVGLVGGASVTALDYAAFSASRFQERLLTVDSGYLDLLLRWGWLMAPVYLTSLLKVVSMFALPAVKRSGSSTSMALFLGFIPVATTWSVFSWEHGLIILFMGFAVDAIRGADFE